MCTFALEKSFFFPTSTGRKPARLKIKQLYLRQRSQYLYRYYQPHPVLQSAWDGLTQPAVGLDGEPTQNEESGGSDPSAISVHTSASIPDPIAYSFSIQMRPVGPHGFVIRSTEDQSKPDSLVRREERAQGEEELLAGQYAWLSGPDCAPVNVTPSAPAKPNIKIPKAPSARSPRSLATQSMEEAVNVANSREEQFEWGAWIETLAEHGLPVPGDRVGLETTLVRQVVPFANGSASETEEVLTSLVATPWIPELAPSGEHPSAFAGLCLCLEPRELSESPVTTSATSAKRRLGRTPKTKSSGSSKSHKKKEKRKEGVQTVVKKKIGRPRKHPLPEPKTPVKTQAKPTKKTPKAASKTVGMMVEESEKQLKRLAKKQAKQAKRERKVAVLVQQHEALVGHVELDRLVA